MKKEDVCASIRKIGIIPAIRVSSTKDAQFAAEAVCGGGIPIVEITMTVPKALDVIAHLVRTDSKIVVGAGTVLNVETARQCVDAGAHYLTNPGFLPKIVEFGVKQGIATLPGALTPSEVIAAWEAGADFVKIFPTAQLGGPDYIKALKVPLPQVPLIASGGITQQTAADFILAGAVAIGVGGALIPPEAIERHQAERIHELAVRFVGFVQEARNRLAGHPTESRIPAHRFRH